MSKNRYINTDKIFVRINYIVASIFLIIALYPLWYVLIASFSDMKSVMRGEVLLWIKGFNLEGYKAMLEESEIWTGYKNTIIYTVIGTCINLIFTVPAGYVLSRKTLPFRRAINLYFLFTMFVNGGLIPTYLLVQNLKLANTTLIMVLLGAVNIWNMIICRTFFENSIPVELIEAAKIDGSSELGIFWRVVLPLSKPIMAVMTLYFAVSHWNSYYNALIYLRDREKWPLQLILRELLLQSQAATMGEGIFTEEMLNIQSMKFGVVVVSSLPVLVLYPFVQKYFVKGVMVGAVKG